MNEVYRPGTMVDPKTRLDKKQIGRLHQASMQILDDPGVTCFNEDAADVFDRNGCIVRLDETQKAWRIRFPEKVIDRSLESVPGRVVLGARNPDNRLLLEADVPRVYFGTGSETNIVLKTGIEACTGEDDASAVGMKPYYSRERGTINHLCRSAKLCNALPNVDFFIRNVNIQDPEITPDNKDIHVFLASLMFMTKHVQAGLVHIERLDDVIRMAEIVAGGPDRLKHNPVLSFITCLVKSPLQMVEDTTGKLMAIAKRHVPVVISSSPQGGSTAPIREEGMVALINAEILSGIALAQMVSPGTPILYGAVPVRARMDTLHDLYGAPEFIHYNINCVQMARHYGIPCYSTAGVGDSGIPGIQATIEKVFSQIEIASSGAQYIHYAFGLLDKTNIFCPLQAVLDDAQIGLVRQILRRPVFNDDDVGSAVEEIRKVMESSTRLFARHIRKAMRQGLVSASYPFEGHEDEDRVLMRANERLHEIMNGPDDKMEQVILDQIVMAVPGLLPLLRFDTESGKA